MGNPCARCGNDLTLFEVMRGGLATELCTECMDIILRWLVAQTALEEGEHPRVYKAVLEE